MPKLAIAALLLIASLAGCRDRDQEPADEASPAADTEPTPPAPEDAAPRPDREEPAALGGERVRLVEEGAALREAAWKVPGGEVRLRIENGECGEGSAACEMEVVAALGEEVYRLHRFGPVTRDQTIEAMLDESGNPHVLLISWESESRQSEANTRAVRLTWDAGEGRPRAGGTWEMPGPDPDPETIDLGEGRQH